MARLGWGRSNAHHGVIANVRATEPLHRIRIRSAHATTTARCSDGKRDDLFQNRPFRAGQPISVFSSVFSVVCGPHHRLPIVAAAAVLSVVTIKIIQFVNEAQRTKHFDAKVGYCSPDWVQRKS